MLLLLFSIAMFGSIEVLYRESLFLTLWRFRVLRSIGLGWSSAASVSSSKIVKVFNTPNHVPQLPQSSTSYFLSFGRSVVCEIVTSALQSRITHYQTYRVAVS
jgi:hypothetical protein